MQQDRKPLPEAADIDDDTPDPEFEARYAELLRQTREHLDTIASRRRAEQKAWSQSAAIAWPRKDQGLAHAA